MIPEVAIFDAKGEPPRGWIVPPVVVYVATRGQRDRVRSAKETFVRNLKAASRRAGLDGVELRMVLPSDPGAPSIGGVCPNLAWLAGRARRAPMPRLLYVARFNDLALDGNGLAKTLQVLLDADFSVRACDALLSAADRSLETFRASNAVVAPAPGTRTETQNPARRTSARVSRGGTRIPPTLTGEA